MNKVKNSVHVHVHVCSSFNNIVDISCVVVMLTSPLLVTQPVFLCGCPYTYTCRFTVLDSSVGKKRILNRKFFYNPT